LESIDDDVDGFKSGVKHASSLFMATNSTADGEKRIKIAT
jgi:hypothetical protein